jgi:hypothetical protein
LYQEDIPRRRNFKNFPREMLKKLMNNLIKNRTELIDKLNSFREVFKKKERKVRADLEEAYKIWKKMNQTLKKRKENKNLKREEMK